MIGLSAAWRLAQRGARVTVYDPAPGRGASHAAGGMLAPVTEAWFGEEPLVRLMLASVRRWPDFARELQAATGQSTGHRPDGTLLVSYDADDRVALRRLETFHEHLHFPVERLTTREAREVEPLLAPTISGALLVRGDHSVDNRRLVHALLAACELTGVAFQHDRVGSITGAADTPERRPAIGLTDGNRVVADHVVLAAGAWSPLVDGIPDAPVRAIRPVKGEILRLRCTAATGPILGRTLRAIVEGGAIYVVPRADGEVVVGATSLDTGYDATVTAGGVWQLLRHARAVLPMITELEFVEAWAGLRPGSADNAPIIGASALPGVTLAAGHGRNGIALTPITAEAVAAAVLDGTFPPEVAGFGPDRAALAAASVDAPTLDAQTPPAATTAAGCETAGLGAS